MRWEAGALWGRPGGIVGAIAGLSFRRAQQAAIGEGWEAIALEGGSIMEPVRGDYCEVGNCWAMESRTRGLLESSSAGWRQGIT